MPCARLCLRSNEQRFPTLEAAIGIVRPVEKLANVALFSHPCTAFFEGAPPRSTIGFDDNRSSRQNFWVGVARKNARHILSLRYRGAGNCLESLVFGKFKAATV